VPHRRIVPLLAVAAAVVGSAACADEQSAALRVDDETVSSTELFDELELITTNDEFRAATIGENVPLSELQGPLRSSYTQTFAAAILNQRLRYLLADDVLADNDLEVTSSDRQSIERQIEELMPSGGSDDLPEAYRDDLVEGLARLSVLQESLGSQEAGTALREAAESADIEVSSHFGTWNEDTLSIDPPPGPAGASDDEAGSGQG
jgi:hypothetical protein